MCYAYINVCKDTWVNKCFYVRLSVACTLFHLNKREDYGLKISKLIYSSF